MKKGTLALLFLALGSMAGCDARTQCQAQYTDPAEVDACIDGGTFGANRVQLMKAMGSTGGGAYAAFTYQCTQHCKSFPEHTRAACVDPCKATGAYLLQSN